MTKILFDPGHAKYKAGAINARLGVSEYECNLIQSRAAYSVLKKAGFEIEVYDPSKDDLLAIGKHAKGFDGFVSLHLNASENTEAQYTTCCVHEIGAKPSSKQLASKIICELIKALGFKPYRGQFGPGVMYLPSKVLSAAEKACKGPCVLTEAFFITSADWRDAGEIKQAAEKAGVAVGQAVAAYFATISGKN